MLKVLDQSIPKRAYLFLQRFPSTVEYRLDIDKPKNIQKVIQQDVRAKYFFLDKPFAQAAKEYSPDVVIFSTPYMGFKTGRQDQESCLPRYRLLLQENNNIKAVTLDMGWDVALFHPWQPQESFQGRFALAGLSPERLTVDKSIVYFPHSEPDLDIVHEAKSVFNKQQVLQDLSIPDHKRYIVVTLYNQYQYLPDLYKFLKPLEKKYHIVWKLKHRNASAAKMLKRTIFDHVKNSSFVVGYNGEVYDVFSPFVKLTTIADYHIQVGPRTSTAQAEMAYAGVPTFRFLGKKFGKNNRILQYLISLRWPEKDQARINSGQFLKCRKSTQPATRFFFTDSLLENVVRFCKE